MTSSASIIFGQTSRDAAWLVYMVRTPSAKKSGRTIPAGSGQKVVPFSEYDGVNKVYLTDGASWVRGGKYSGGDAEVTAMMESDAAAEESAAAAREARGEISEVPGGR